MTPGTAGFIGFPTFRRRWIDEAHTRILAFMNVSELGIVVDDGFELGERELRHVDVERTVAVIEANRDVCLGVKVRMATNQTAPPRGERPLDLALEIAERTGTRVMVHITEPGVPLDRVFDRVRQRRHRHPPLPRPRPDHRRRQTGGCLPPHAAHASGA